MALLDELQPASFKGVTFLIDSTSTTGGRKTVTHEYPNADRRYVEDLGKLQETFSITGIISGSNYIAQRDNLIRVLNEGGRGELVHPFFGSVQVVAKPYTLSENLTDLGVARFSMTFEKADESIFPSISSNNTSLINQKVSDLADLVGTDLASIFSVRKQYPLNFISAKDILNGFADSIGINADNVLKVADEISSFSGFLLGFTENINDNINNPPNLASEFNLLFQSFSTIGRNVRDQFELLENLFSYGSGETPIAQTTVQNVERETNRQIINSAVNISALTYAYNTATQLTYTTEEDIAEIGAELDTQFDYIMSNNNVTDDTIQALKNLRVEVKKFLEQEQVNTYKISTILTKEIPMTILCYNYYGSVDNTQTLLNLNETINPTFVEGNTKILTI